MFRSTPPNRYQNEPAAAESAAALPTVTTAVRPRRQKREKIKGGRISSLKAQLLQKMLNRHKRIEPKAESAKASSSSIQTQFQDASLPTIKLSSSSSSLNSMNHNVNNTQTNNTIKGPLQTMISKRLLRRKKKHSEERLYSDQQQQLKTLPTWSPECAPESPKTDLIPICSFNDNSNSNNDSSSSSCSLVDILTTTTSSERNTSSSQLSYTPLKPKSLSSNEIDDDYHGVIENAIGPALFLEKMEEQQDKVSSYRFLFVPAISSLAVTSSVMTLLVVSTTSALLWISSTLTILLALCITKQDCMLRLQQDLPVTLQARQMERESWERANLYLRSRLLAGRVGRDRATRQNDEARIVEYIRAAKHKSLRCLSVAQVVTMVEQRDANWKWIQNHLKKQVLLTITKAVVITNRKAGFVLNALGLEIIIARVSKIPGVHLDASQWKALLKKHGHSTAALLALYRVVVAEEELTSLSSTRMITYVPREWQPKRR